MIALKQAYDPFSRADGTRFLVERLWPRGPGKAKLPLDAWLKDVGPDNELRQWVWPRSGQVGRVPQKEPARARLTSGRVTANRVGLPVRCGHARLQLLRHGIRLSGNLIIERLKNTIRSGLENRNERKRATDCPLGGGRTISESLRRTDPVRTPDRERERAPPRKCKVPPTKFGTFCTDPLPSYVLRWQRTVSRSLGPFVAQKPP